MVTTGNKWWKVLTTHACWRARVGARPSEGWLESQSPPGSPPSSPGGHHQGVAGELQSRACHHLPPHYPLLTTLLATYYPPPSNLPSSLPSTTKHRTLTARHQTVTYEYRISIRKDRPDEATPTHPNLVNQVFITVVEWEMDQTLWEQTDRQLRELVQSQLEDVTSEDLPDGYQLQEVEDEVYLQVNYQDTIWTGATPTINQRYVTRRQRRKYTRINTR